MQRSSPHRMQLRVLCEQQDGTTVSATDQTLSNDTEVQVTTDTVHYGFYDNSGVLQAGTNLGNGWAAPQQDKDCCVQEQRHRFGTGSVQGQRLGARDALGRLAVLSEVITAAGQGCRKSCHWQAMTTADLSDQLQ